MGTYLQLGTVAVLRNTTRTVRASVDVCHSGPGGHADPSAALLLVSGNVTMSEPASFIYIVLSTAWNCAVRRDP